MLISIDESGSFVHAATPGAWCVVAGYTFAERSKSSTYAALAQAKASSRRKGQKEVKLKHLSEGDYFRFLHGLRRSGGALFAVATDTSYATPAGVVEHRRLQAEKVRSNIPRMIYEEGKAAVATLADEIESLSPQLYVQLLSQVLLIQDLLSRGILFHVQRDPVTLRRFVFRIDQKNTTKTTYERAFQNVAPAFLQSISFREPMIMLEGADYSHFAAFEQAMEEYPKYLQEELGHEPQAAANIGKLLGADMRFPDSKMDASVQVADLLASGIRRCLRGGFSNNRTAAALLGRLMVQNAKGSHPIRLVTLTDSTTEPDRTAALSVVRFEKYAQPMLR